VKNDPVAKMAALLPHDERAAIEQEVEAEVAAAFAFAEASPFPAAGELMTDIYQEAGDALACR
jgi:TPP-dependent pyruvate/acetoin dehydrogenase alpha subunit